MRPCEMWKVRIWLVNIRKYETHAHTNSSTEYAETTQSDRETGTSERRRLLDFWCVYQQRRNIPENLTWGVLCLEKLCIQQHTVGARHKHFQMSCTHAASLNCVLMGLRCVHISDTYDRCFWIIRPVHNYATPHHTHTYTHMHTSPKRRVAWEL